MNEIDWFASSDPAPMLAYLRGKVSDRKLRLFAAACCRHVLDLLTDERDREALEVLERFADDLANRTELRDASRQGVRLTPLVAGLSNTRRPTAAAVASVAVCSRLRAEASGYLGHPKGAGDYYAGELGEMAAQCRLLRDIIGSPFRHAAFDPSWRTSTAVGLAERMYESRDFSATPILADALQDVGCDDEQVLAHCRQPGDHVRGCWVVDLVLGRS